MFDKKYISTDRNATSSISVTNIENTPEMVEEPNTYDMAVKLNLFDIRLYAYAQQLHCVVFKNKTHKECMSTWKTTSISG